MMSAFRRLDPALHDCDIDRGAMILVSCGIMTGLACITLIARIYTRGWVTHSTDRDDYTIWVAVVREREIELSSLYG